MCQGVVSPGTGTSRSCRLAAVSCALIMTADTSSATSTANIFEKAMLYVLMWRRAAAARVTLPQ